MNFTVECQKHVTHKKLTFDIYLALFSGAHSGKILHSMHEKISVSQIALKM